MAEIRIVEVSVSTAAELAWFCVPPEKRGDPAFRTGVEAKKAWIRERVETGVPVAKIAYFGPEAAGIVQYELVPEESVVHIHCTFVPEERHWRKGIGTELLRTLMEEMRRPQPWNGGRPALGVTTHAFPGHLPGQLPAQEFFRRRGFNPVGDDPDFLFFPLRPGGRYQRKRMPPAHIPQPEDQGQALILHGPSFCPWAYLFNLKAAQVIQEIAPGIPIRWMDRAKEPAEAGKRGGYEGVVVNTRPIRALVFDRDEFIREVREALTG